MSVYFHTTDLNALDEKLKGFQGKHSEVSVCIWEKNILIKKEMHTFTSPELNSNAQNKMGQDMPMPICFYNVDTHPNTQTHTSSSLLF